VKVALGLRKESGDRLVVEAQRRWLLDPRPALVACLQGSDPPDASADLLDESLWPIHSVYPLLTPQVPNTSHHVMFVKLNDDVRRARYLLLQLPDPTPSKHREYSCPPRREDRTILAYDE
jgi:hypothetical protein